jgi:Glycosyltransferase family 9 (heptosyltransferase)
LSHYIIQRTKGFGDVIAATGIATHLFNAGHTVTFQTDSLCHQVLRFHPHIAKVALSHCDRPDIDLGDIEQAQRRVHIQEAFGDIARRCVKGVEFPITNPVLGIQEDERAPFHQRLAKLPHPWVFVCPGSWQAPNRTVTKATWLELFDAYPDATFINPTADVIGGRSVYVGDGSFRGLMAAVSLADMLITVDSGPMHVGAALGVPMVIIQQAWPISLRIAPGAVFTQVNCGLPCSPCKEHVCKVPGVNRAEPPCQIVDAGAIIRAMRNLMP